MLTILLITQVIIVSILVLTVLFQKSGGDGISGLAGGGNGVISNKASANFITKITFILAFLFMANSLALAKLTIYDIQKSGKLIESIVADQQTESVDDAPLVPSAK